jgi:uncharacterized membrane protein
MTDRVLAALIPLVSASTALACPLCDSETGRQVRAGIFNADFVTNLVLTLLPFPVLLGLVAWIHFGPTPDPVRHLRRPAMANRRPLLSAGMLLGIGLGGFVDGILFHQLLQTHNMLTGRYPKLGVDVQTALVNTEINMFWDGLFHVITWLTTALGLALLWRAAGRPDVPHSTGTLLGSMALGWGLFNLIEGVIDHHLLHLHHVVEGPNHLVYDLAFLLSGVVLIFVGLTFIRTAGRAAVATGP